MPGMVAGNSPDSLGTWSIHYQRIDGGNGDVGRSTQYQRRGHATGPQIGTDRRGAPGHSTQEGRMFRRSRFQALMANTRPTSPTCRWPRWPRSCSTVAAEYASHGTTSPGGMPACPAVRTDAAILRPCIRSDPRGTGTRWRVRPHRYRLRVLDSYGAGNRAALPRLPIRSGPEGHHGALAKVEDLIAPDFLPVIR